MWPDADDEEDYDFIARDEAELGPGVRALLGHLGVADEPQRYPTGSLPVYAAGDLVLKLFPPVYIDEFPIEAGVLSAVQGRLPVPTPRVHGTGEFEGWGYVLMDRLRGRSLSEAWDDLTPAGRERTADELGAALAALHRLPVPRIDDWDPEDFDEFERDQRAGCAGRHKALGLGAEWAEQIPAFLDDVDLTVDRPVLLHTEIGRDHLLVGGDGALRGLFDFEPAIRGAAEYEFVGVGCFVAEGDAAFLGRTMRAYGYPDGALDREWRRRMLGWTLLHRYSNLGRYLQRLPGPAAPTLASLADRWFGTT